MCTKFLAPPKSTAARKNTFRAPPIRRLKKAVRYLVFWCLVVRQAIDRQRVDEVQAVSIMKYKQQTTFYESGTVYIAHDTMQIGKAQPP